MPVLSPAGDLVGLVSEGYEGGSVTLATAGEVISKDASGRPVGGEIQVRVNAKGRCRLEARVDLDDPLGTFRRVTLSMAPPRWIPAFPRDRRGLGSVGSVLATVVPSAGRAALAADVPCADRYHAQLGIDGEHEHWLSIPYGLGRGQGSTWRRAVAGERAWRRDGLGVSWPRSAPAPATGSVPQCLPPADTLDPDTVYVITGPSDRCTGSTLTPVDGGSPRCAQIGLGQAVAISPQGRLLYRANMEDGDVYRLHAGDVPDVGSPLAGCQARAPELNDEIVAIDPCGSGRAASEAFDVGAGVLTECDGRWSQVDGATVETHGGQLVRAGRRGRLLLSPWDSLAVAGPSGRPIEVAGLPRWANGASLRASRATPDAFLVALGGREGAMELYSIDLTGRASARATYPELPDVVQRAVLDARGRLHVVSREKLFRLEPAGARAAILGSGSDLVTGFASAPGRRGRWPNEREVYLGSPAARIYQAPPGAMLACAANLAVFDPRRVYVLGGQDVSHVDGEPPAVFDAADPSRFAYGAGMSSWQRSMVTPDGHLLHLDGDGTLREFRPDGARLDATRGRCGLVNGLAEGDPSVAAACPRVVDFSLAPSSGALALSCWDPATGQAWASLGGHRFPSVKAGRVFAGDGLLLVQEERGARILSANGKVWPVRGLPAAILAARATRDGFDVVIMPWASPKPRVERWRIGADGTATLAGTYGLGSAPLGIALQEDGSILAQYGLPANTIVRAFTDGRPEESLWVGRPRGGPPTFAFATGP